MLATTRTGRDPTVHDILENVRGYHPSPDLSMIQRAFVFAEQHHRPQRRKSGNVRRVAASDPV